MFLILKPTRIVLKALITTATPRELALGFAFGVLVGLVPKGNLTAVILGVLLAASRANLGVATATILACSFLAPLLDPASDLIGGWLLTHPALQSMWTRLYNQPGMPWTDFNNSVVLGSFVIGLLLVYPSYRLSHRVFKQYTGKVAKWARRFRLTRVLLGMEIADRLNLSR